MRCPRARTSRRALLRHGEGHLPSRHGTGTAHRMGKQGGCDGMDLSFETDSGLERTLRNPIAYVRTRGLILPR